MTKQAILDVENVITVLVFGSKSGYFVIHKHKIKLKNTIGLGHLTSLKIMGLPCKLSLLL